jgi:hypothetical protein
VWQGVKAGSAGADIRKDKPQNGGCRKAKSPDLLTEQADFGR